MALNKVMLIGHLGADPELRYTQSGQAMTTFRMATSESYRAQDGNMVEKTEWHRIIVWGKQAENVNTYLVKGSQVYVEGSLQTRQWEDQNGQTRYTTEIKALRVQFLDKAGNRQAGPQPQQQRPPQGPLPAEDDLGPAFPSEASGMDDVPF